MATFKSIIGAIREAITSQSDKSDNELALIQTTDGGSSIIVEKGLFEDFIAATDLSEGSRIGTPPLVDPYGQSGWVKSCIDAITNDVAGVPFKIMDGSTELKDGPIYNLFHNPNEQLDGFQLWKATQHFLESMGEAIWIFDEFGIGGIPQKVFIFNPSKFKEVIDRSTGELIGWIYTAKNRSPIGFTLEETLHFRQFNPNDDVRGLSTIGGARLAVEGDYFAQIYNKSFFQNSAEPGGFLTSDKPIDTRGFKRIAEAWRARHQGTARAKRVAILEGGLKWESASVNPKDMEFVTLRKLSREEIASLFSVPPSRIGILDHVNYATSKEERRIYWESTVVPKVTYLDSRTNHFLSRFGSITLIHDLDAVGALKETLSDKLDCAEKFARLNVPLVEINRRLNLGLDLTNIPWSNTVLVPISLLPIDLVASGNNPLLGNGEEQTNSIKVISTSKPIEKEIKLITSKEEDKQEFPNSILPTKEHRLAYWKGFVATLLPMERRFLRALRDYQSEQRQQVITNIFNAFKSKSYSTKASADEIAETFIFDLDEETRKLKKISAPFFEQSLKSGADALLIGLGLDPFNVDNPQAISFLATKLIKIVRPLITSKKELKATLKEGLESNESVKQLSERVGKHYDTSFIHQRTVARTEIAQSANGGRFIALQEIAEEIEWVTAGDEVVRESHAAEEGNTVRIGEYFPETGLRYPNDIEATDPSEVINCRCTIVASKFRE